MRFLRFFASTNTRRRPPIVTIMGHVDHGKTTLLDCLRRTRVAASEAGGITQHIGAFSVSISSERITFLDTPGHAAFSGIRDRGTRLTDLVVLVVAAEDGLMAQTVEAIDLVQTYQVPLILAINKCDRPGWQLHRARIHQQMARYGLVVEEMGGTVQSIPISALTGWNVERIAEAEEDNSPSASLLDAILAEAEMLELPSQSEESCSGGVLEVRHLPALGIAASLLVQRGILHTGAVLVAGESLCRVRQMWDCQGRVITEAGPSKPVQVVGWRTDGGVSPAPIAGATWAAQHDERAAMQIINERMRAREERAVLEALDEAAEREKLDQRLLRIARNRSDPSPPRSTFHYEELNKNDDIPELNIVLKCDVAGSVEAIRKAFMEQLPRRKAITNVIYAGIGPVTESDLDLARSARNGKDPLICVVNFVVALIVAFNTGVLAPPHRRSHPNNAPLISHRIIYALLDDVRARLAALLPPILEERVAGRATVLQLFPIDGGREWIVGCRVEEGVIAVGSSNEQQLQQQKRIGPFVRVLRGQSVLLERAKVRSIRHGKREITSASKGMECGIALEAGGSTLAPGDQLHYIQIHSKPDTID